MQHPELTYTQQYKSYIQRQPNSILLLVMLFSLLLSACGGYSGGGTGFGLPPAPCAAYERPGLAYYCIDGSDTLGDIEAIAGMTTIDRDLIIDKTSLSSLDFLSDIETINGKLTIANNSQLTAITTSATLITLNDLEIVRNEKLVSLQGFSIGTTAENVKIAINPLLQDIAATNQLTAVTSLQISSNSLSDLTDLSNLVTAKDKLSISEKNITDLTGLSSLQSTGQLIIVSTSNLSSLSGLDVLTDYHSLVIVYTPLLTTLSSLPAVPANLKYLNISNNESLSDISALYPVTSITELIQFYKNPMLSSFDGLNNMTTAGRVSIDTQASLKDLSSLAMLEVVESLNISDNNQLADLGLTALRRVNDSLYIRYNSGLCTSKAEALRDQVLSRDGIGAVDSRAEIGISWNGGC